MLTALNALLLVLLVELSLAGAALTCWAWVGALRLLSSYRAERAQRLLEERELLGVADLLQEVRDASRG